MRAQKSSLVQSRLARNFVLEPMEPRFMLSSVVANISTGIDRATGLKLPNNATDPNYVMAAGSTLGIGMHPIARSAPLPAPYITDASSTASRWISVLTNNGAEGLDGPAGYYNYQTTVNLTGFDPSTAVLSSIRFASDNKLINVYVNGTIVASPIPDGSHNGLEAFHTLPTRLGAGLFTAGINTITFKVINDELTEAFRYEGSVIATRVTGPASIAGKAYLDDNGNGVADSGELPLKGWTIFLDKNNNGAKDAGESSKLADASGNYSFTGLAGGTQHVRAVLQSGWVRTSPSVVPGQKSTGKNFGVAAPATVAGTIFRDVNTNGRRDAGESALVGWKVFIDSNKNGILDAGEKSVLTNSSGAYSLTGLKPGSLSIKAIAPAGKSFVFPTSGVRQATLGSGQSLGGVNFAVKA
jgi:hypothetical protein